MAAYRMLAVWRSVMLWQRSLAVKHHAASQWLLNNVARMASARPANLWRNDYSVLVAASSTNGGVVVVAPLAYRRRK